MSDGNRKIYWEQRGRLTYKYKGETFYTVTPIPLYYRRRTILLTYLTSILNDKNPERICDFGCGDGWYLNYLSKRFAAKQWTGIDLSSSMIDKARQQCPRADLILSGDGIPISSPFDMVYSIAVFAHVMDDGKVKALFQNISANLLPDGYFVIFEQTGPQRNQGNTWCRRSLDEYIKIAEQSGLSVENYIPITFPIHRFFEKRIAPYYYRLFSTGSNCTERCIRANRSIIFRAISALMVSLSGNPMRYDGTKHEGNTFFVFRKRAQQNAATDGNSAALHPRR